MAGHKSNMFFEDPTVGCQWLCCLTATVPAQPDWYLSRRPFLGPTAATARSTARSQRPAIQT
jgi:hypothetical protein